MTPARNDDLRDRAAAAFAATGTVRGTAKIIGRSVGWTHALLVEIGVRGNDDSRVKAQRRRRKRERELADQVADDHEEAIREDTLIDEIGADVARRKRERENDHSVRPGSQFS